MGFFLNISCKWTVSNNEHITLNIINILHWNNWPSYHTYINGIKFLRKFIEQDNVYYFPFYSGGLEPNENTIDSQEKKKVVSPITFLSICQETVIHLWATILNKKIIEFIDSTGLNHIMFAYNSWFQPVESMNSMYTWYLVVH